MMSGNSTSKISGVAHKKYTLNFDGSHINQKKQVGVGCIIRDNHGKLVVAASYNLSKEFSNYCDVAIAEAAALLNGLKLAKEFNIKLNLIQGDSQEVINHVVLAYKSSKRSFKNHLKGVRQPLSGIIQQIVGMLDRSEKIELIYREANQVADILASYGSRELQGGRKLFINDAELPPQVAKLINKGKSGSMDELIKQVTTEIVNHRDANQVADKCVRLESSKVQGGYMLATNCNANLPPQKTCVPKACEYDHLKGKVCQKCDELQEKLTEKDKMIAKLDIEIKILLNQNLKLEEKGGDLKNSIQEKLTAKDKMIAKLETQTNILLNKYMKSEEKGRDLEKTVDSKNKELCQMRDEKMGLVVIVMGILFYIIYFRV